MEVMNCSDVNKRKSSETSGNIRKKVQNHCTENENTKENPQSSAACCMAVIDPQPLDVNYSGIYPQQNEASCSQETSNQPSDVCSSAVISPQTLEPSCSTVISPQPFGASCSTVISPQPSEACCSAVISPQPPEARCSTVVSPQPFEACCSTVISPQPSDACCSAAISPQTQEANCSTVFSPQPFDASCSTVISSQPSEACCSAATVENVLEDMEEEIDNALEQPCHKNKLSSKNVKSILRHIIANEYVLNMVRSTMNPSELAYEPNLTRSKAKEMRKKQVSLPWPVASPAKTVPKVSKIILEEEFPDESSGDEDYKPNEEECHSDEDATSRKEASSRAQSLASSPVAKVVEPMSEEENALVIAFPELDVPNDYSEEDKIALRTRSKLCLNDTPLEEIEASLIAPDITMDMYAVYCDDKDWQSFLCELNKSTDSTTVVDYPDDAENDPEYNDPEEVVPDYDDLLDEEITPDEWNDLMAGNLELAQEDLSFLDDEDEEEESRINVEYLENVGPPSEINLGQVCVENVNTIWMTSDERLQLDEQMRMYVQLVTQSYLLSHENPALQSFNVSTKIILEEIKMFATRDVACGNSSAFYAHNLDGALDIINEFEKINLPSNIKNRREPRHRFLCVPQHIQRTLATNKVFIYPELLPTCGFHSIVDFDKHFTTPEDNLITLGLEQFSMLENPIECIKKYLLPTKSVKQIKTRIKNCKIKKDPLENSIKYYHVHYQVPKFQRVIRIFDPNNIKAPENYPPEYLPLWMQPYSKHSISQPASVSTQSAKPSPKVSVPQHRFRKALHPRKYVQILPRGLNFSAVMNYQSLPFLKKYSHRQCRKPIRKASYVLSPLKPKPGPSNSKIQENLIGTHNRNLNNSFSSVSSENELCSTSEDGDESIATPNKITTSPAIQNSNSKTEGKENSICESLDVVKSSKENYSINEVSKKAIKNGKKPKAFVGKENTTKDKNSVASIETTAAKDQKSNESENKTISCYGKTQHGCKTRSQHQRDLDASLALLQPTVKGQEVMFANSYLLRAIEILKDDPEVCEKFLSTLSKYDESMRSPVELYLELKETLKDYPALVRDSIILLRPEQAKQCGRYEEHIALSKTRKFFKKIEVHFKDEPERINQIVIKFAQLREQVDITSSEMIKALQPLLKNQTHLIKELNSLLSSPK